MSFSSCQRSVRRSAFCAPLGALGEHANRLPRRIHADDGTKADQKIVEHARGPREGARAKVKERRVDVAQRDLRAEEMWSAKRGDKDKKAEALTQHELGE